MKLKITQSRYTFLLLQKIEKLEKENRELRGDKVE